MKRCYRLDLNEPVSLLVHRPVTMERMTHPDLEGTIALVAGATRGAGRGIAVSLGEAGATVYCTGRSTRAARSEYDRPETIEETAELVTEAGGTRHRRPGRPPRARAGARARRAHRRRAGPPRRARQRRLGRREAVRVGHARLGARPRQRPAAVDLALKTHLITSHFALPLLIRNPGGLVVEMTDGTAEYNATTYRINAFYDLAKCAVIRLAFAQSKDLAPHGATAVALTPGWLRSEMMLEAFGVTEANWRDATRAHPPLRHLRDPALRRPRRRRARRRPGQRRHTGASLSSGGLAREYGFTDLDGSRPDAWRYMVEVQDPGLPANPEPYR